MPQRQGRDTPASGVDHHDQLHRRFGWQVPKHFNMAEVCSRRWATDPEVAARTAVIACAAGQPDQHHSYAELHGQANRLSNARHGADVLAVFEAVHALADWAVVLIYTNCTTDKVQRRVLRLREEARAELAQRG